jgi:hypothetical protein
MPFVTTPNNGEASAVDAYALVEDAEMGPEMTGPIVVTEYRNGVAVLQLSSLRFFGAYAPSRMCLGNPISKP